MKNSLEDIALFLLHALVFNLDNEVIPNASYLPKRRESVVKEAFEFAKEFQRQAKEIEQENDH